MGVLPDVHDGGKTKSPLVEGLAEVGAQHAGKDTAVDSPKQLFVCLVIDVDCCCASILVGLFNCEQTVPTVLLEGGLAILSPSWCAATTLEGTSVVTLSSVN